jgi:hypothetical protein
MDTRAVILENLVRMVAALEKATSVVTSEKYAIGLGVSMNDRKQSLFVKKWSKKDL